MILRTTFDAVVKIFRHMLAIQKESTLSISLINMLQRMLQPIFCFKVFAGSNLATTFAGWSSMEVTDNTTGHAAS